MPSPAISTSGNKKGGKYINQPTSIGKMNLIEPFDSFIEVIELLTLIRFTRNVGNFA